jgi:DNA-binding response OmpR family regulator
MARKKILLVDDSPTILMMEQMILGKGPYELIIAQDGEEGVAKALAELPDLILMDVVMPKLDGFGAVERLRAHDATRETPIIMITTRSEAQNVETGFASGCNDYITKPLNGLELMTKVQNYLGE